MDGALAAVFLTAGVAHLVLTGTRAPLTIGAIVGTTAALLVRRHAPLPVAVACLAMFAVVLVVEDDPSLLQVGPMIALYFVGEQLGVRTAVVVATSCALAAILVWTLLGPDSVDFALGAVLVIAPIAVGQTVAHRRAYVMELHARLDAVLAARTSEVARLVLQERLAMARDLHDIVAHTVAVVNVQASVALRHTRGNEPATAALTAIRTSSAQALDELRTVLGVLRRGEEMPASSPSSLTALVQSVAGANLTVALTADPGQLADLQRDAPAVLLVAHRVVQEGLTNVLRHSTACGAEVAVTVSGGCCRIEVLDAGPARAGPTTQLGSGLDGLRDRVMLHSGTLTAGHRPEGGFRLYAEIPVRRREDRLDD